MYQKKKKTKNIILIIVVGVILFLSISYFVLRKKERLSPIESLIKDGGLFVQKIIMAPFSFLSDKVTDQELKQLKEKANSSASLEAKNKELENQITELKKSLDLNTVLSEQVYLNATTINRNMDYWYHTITVDKGRHSGVENNMPVVVSEGLVGTTSNVSNFNSTIKLLTNEEFSHKISIKIEVNGHYVYGLLSGYNSTNKMLQVEGVAENTEIPIGSLVTTTGLGENMPAGIVVGYVKNITTDNFDLAKLVEVESKVNFDEIRYVTILKRKGNAS